MKFLIDTNVFIPLEITSHDDFEKKTPLALELARQVSHTKQQLYLHPIQKEDFKDDKNDERRKVRGIIFDKYLSLAAPPVVSPILEEKLGFVPKISNDWVDHNLIAALYGDAVDYLVTEDLRLIKKVELLGLKNRVASITEAITIIRDLLDVSPSPPPAVKNIQAYNINVDDPIWDSMGKDYYPYFDNWLKKCKREHRTTWIIPMSGTNEYGAISIVKKENAVGFGIKGNILKICCFKVSEKCNGFRFGELLLKTVFEFAIMNGYMLRYLKSMKD